MIEQLPRLGRRRFLAFSGAAFVLAACSDASTDGSESTLPNPTTGATNSPTSQLTSPTGSTNSTDDPSADATTVAPATATTVDSESLVALSAADFEALGVCAVLAETTAGPFPTLEQLDRADVTEGYPGHPLRLGLRVVDATCAPIAGAIVEIWHTDATGDYSSYADNGGGKDEGEGTTFMRGFQTSDDDGIVEFQTVFPGWYPGRAVHIHVRVDVDGSTVLTGQLFFDDDYTATVFGAAPYAEFGLPDTPNAADRIAGPALATGGLLALSPGATSLGEGTVALANLGVAA